MRNKSVFILFVLIIAIMPFHCTKEKLVGEYYLSNEDISYVPYSIDDSINYIFNAGDTVIMVCVNEGSAIKDRHYISNLEYFYFESFRSVLRSPDYSLYYRLSTYTSKPTLTITWFDNNNNDGGFLFNLPLNPGNLPDNQKYIPEMSINGVSYYDVYVDTNDSYNSSYNGYYYPITLFYTKEYGTIKLEFSNGDSWEIISN